MHLNGNKFKLSCWCLNPTAQHSVVWDHNKVQFSFFFSFFWYKVVGSKRQWNYVVSLLALFPVHVKCCFVSEPGRARHNHPICVMLSRFPLKAAKRELISELILRMFVIIARHYPSCERTRSAARPEIDCINRELQKTNLFPIGWMLIRSSQIILRSSVVAVWSNVKRFLVLPP